MSSDPSTSRRGPQVPSRFAGRLSRVLDGGDDQAQHLPPQEPPKNNKSRNRTNGGGGQRNGNPDNRNKRMMASLQSALGTSNSGGGQLRRNGPRRQSPSDDASFKVENCDELVERLAKMNINVDISAKELTRLLTVNLHSLTGEEMDRVAECLCDSAVLHGNAYCIVDLVLAVIKNETFQDAFSARLASLMTDYIFDTEHKFDALPEFLANLLVANFPRPYHRAIDGSNVILFTIVSALKGWLMVLSGSKEEGEQGDEAEEEEGNPPDMAERCAQALGDLCMCAQRRLWIKWPELVDEIYQGIKPAIIENPELSDKSKYTLMNLLIQMHSWSKAGVTNRVSVQTQTC